jgi:hypothetical protein
MQPQSDPLSKAQKKDLKRATKFASTKPVSYIMPNGSAGFTTEAKLAKKSRKKATKKAVTTKR